MTELIALQDRKLEILGYFPPDMWPEVESVFEQEQAKLWILGLFDHNPKRERSRERAELVRLLCSVWDQYDLENVGADSIMPFRKHIQEIDQLWRAEGD